MMKTLSAHSLASLSFSALACDSVRGAPRLELGFEPELHAVPVSVGMALVAVTSFVAGLRLRAMVTTAGQAGCR